MISKNDIKRIKQLELKKYRQREGLFVAEGPKVVGDLIMSGYSPESIFATEEWIKTNTNLNGRIANLRIISSDELRKISFLQHPQHVIAIFPIPDGQQVSQPQGLCLALDGIQDPGNLGTIIRIADWFGIRNIYCSSDTVDAWNPKVIQATMGSIAHVHISYCDLHETLAHTQLPVYGTLLDGTDIYSQELSDDGIIVMGNEGNGISDSIRKLVNHRLLIPSYNTGDSAESLNVAIATAITCAEFRRRTQEKKHI